MTPDSVTYVVSAAHLADGRGHTGVDGRAITLFPPGFPAVLAPAEAAGVDAAEAATVLNAFLFGAIVVLGWRLARRHVGAWWVAAVAAALLAVSAPLLLVSTRVWSEPLFVVLTLGAVLGVERSLVEPTRPARHAVAAGVLAGLSVLVRYQGVVVVGIGVVVLAGVGGFDRRRHPSSSSRSSMEAWATAARGAARSVGVFAAPALCIPAVWAARNLAAGVGPFGPRAHAVDDLTDTSRRFSEVLTEWLVPADWVGPEPPSARPVVLAILVGVLVAAVVVDRRLVPATPPATGLPAGAGRPRWPLLPVGALVVIGGLWMVVTGTITPLNPLDTRLLIFLYPGLVVLVVWAVETLVRAAPPGAPRRVVLASVVVVGAAWSVTSTARWLDEVAQADEGCCFGASFEAAPLHADALAVAESTTDPIYSNLPDGLWLLRRGTYRWSPARSAYRGADPLDERPGLAHDVACAGGAWLVQYQVGRDWLFDVHELTGFVLVEPDPSPDARGVFRLSPLPGQDRPADC